MKSKAFNRRRGAISVEYIIILVVIAIGGIIGFLVLGTQMKKTSANVTGQFSGDKTAGEAVKTEKARMETLEGEKSKMNMEQADQ